MEKAGTITNLVNYGYENKIFTPAKNITISTDTVFESLNFPVMEFDGTQKLIYSTTDPTNSLNLLTYGGTIELMVKTGSVLLYSQTIFTVVHHSNISDPTEKYLAFDFRLSGNSFYISTISNYLSTSASFLYLSSVTINTWYYIAVSFDSSNSLINFYVTDGTSASKNTFTGITYSQGSTYFPDEIKFGTNINNTFAFTGKICNIRITKEIVRYSTSTLTRPSVLYDLASITSYGINGYTISASRLSTSTTISASGNITTSGVITSSGAITGSSLATSGTITASGAIGGGAIIGSSLATTGTITASGAISGGAISGSSLATSGTITASGAIGGAAVSGTSLATSGTITASGAISGAAVSGTSLASSGTINASGNISTSGTITSSGALSCGNITSNGNAYTNILQYLATGGAQFTTTSGTSITLITVTLSNLIVGKTVIFHTNISCFINTSSAALTFTLRRDGTSVGTYNVTLNEINSHKYFSRVFTFTATATSHAMTYVVTKPTANVLVDSGDYYNYIAYMAI